MAMLRGPRHVFELANEHYLRLVGRLELELLGKPVAVALPEVKAQGFIDLLGTVYRTGVAYEGRQVKVDLQTADGRTGERHVDFVYQPIKDDEGRVTGILVEGIDVTERMEGEERLRLAQQAGGIGALRMVPGDGRDGRVAHLPPPVGHRRRAGNHAAAAGEPGRRARLEEGRPQQA
jgi:PAS domain S-box-containing protein